MKKTLIFVFLLACSSVAGFAQRSELGVFGGVSYYHGEFNPFIPFLLQKPAYGLVYRYNIHTRLAIKANLIHGSLDGKGKYAALPTLQLMSFNTRVNEFSAQLELNYFNYFTGSLRSFISPYIFGGIGFYVFGTTAITPGINPRNQSDWQTFWTKTGAGPKSELAIVFPFGVGVKYSLSKIVGLSLEWGMRKTLNDLLDGLHDFGQSGTQVKNSKDNDWYSFAGAMVTVRLHANKRAMCRETHDVRF
ncbi:MAG: DUF6089 family protein [Bacteroidales bacterium]|nr:DUF6089 family protein [Bacteroidales bacterium]